MTARKATPAVDDIAESLARSADTVKEIGRLLDDMFEPLKTSLALAKERIR